MGAAKLIREATSALEPLNSEVKAIEWFSTCEGFLFSGKTIGQGSIVFYWGVFHYYEPPYLSWYK